MEKKRSRAARKTARPKPAVPIEQSVTRSYIVCPEDGARVTALTPYLKEYFKMTPEQCHAGWGLPDDYPMTPPV